MRLTFLLLFTLIIGTTSKAQDIYSLSFTAIDGNTVNLETYRGKKLLFITIPLSSTDTSVTVTELSAVQTKYASSLVIIGVPMIEGGYTSSHVPVLKNRYKDQPANFILASGMNVKKGAAEQSSLYQWLTDVKKNKHYDADIKGAGHKIFIDETGRQYAVMPPFVKLSSEVVNQVLSYKPTTPAQ